MTIPHLHNLPKMIQLESIRTLISSQVYKTCAFFTTISFFFLILGFLNSQVATSFFSGLIKHFLP